MRFAIISDIHGNLPALNAVIEDAEREKVDKYIFCGDYCLSNPFPDECITRMKNISNKYIIRGNEEIYLKNLDGKDQSTWTDGQMQISYWCYRNVSAENLRYLLSLPAKIEFMCHNIPINISHSSADFIESAEHKEWSTAKVAEKYKDKDITQPVLQKEINTYFQQDEYSKEKINALADGIYIFGHSHIQWNYQSGSGKKILINPGSCGLPLDCIEAGVPYTLLEIEENGNVVVEERRVSFNKREYINTFLQSKQFEYARVWSKIILKELQTNREHLAFFLKYVEEYAVKISDEQRPFSVETWEKAYELWEKGE